jgi:DNA-binding Lrp family transcriptional regulator
VAPKRKDKDLDERRSTMPSAFVLINTESGSEDYVLKQLKNLSGVKESFVSYGVYDLIVKVKAETMAELKEIVSYKFVH